MQAKNEKDISCDRLRSGVLEQVSLRPFKRDRMLKALVKLYEGSTDFAPLVSNLGVPEVGQSKPELGCCFGGVERAAMISCSNSSKNDLTYGKNMAEKVFAMRDYQDLNDEDGGILNIIPATKEDWLLKGIASYRNKNYTEAIQSYEQAIQIEPRYAKAYYGKGLALSRIYRHIGDMVFPDLPSRKEALVAYDQAIRLEPGYIRSYIGKGNVLYHLERYEEALASYRQVIQLNPKCSVAYYGQGSVLYMLGCGEEALASFEQAIRLNPQEINYYFPKIEILYSLDSKKEELMSTWGKILLLAPHEPLRCRKIMESIDYIGSADDKIAICDQLIAAHPSCMNIYLQKAEIIQTCLDDHEHGGRGRGLALDTYNQAIRVNPKYIHIYKYKAALLLDLKLYSLAATAYDPGLQLDPNDSAMHFWRGEALINAKYYGEALEDFEWIIRHNKPENEDVLVYYNKGRSLFECGHYQDAIEAFKEALLLFSDMHMKSIYLYNPYSYGNREYIKDNYHEFISESYYGDYLINFHDTYRKVRTFWLSAYDEKFLKRLDKEDHISDSEKRELLKDLIEKEELLRDLGERMEYIKKLREDIEFLTRSQDKELIKDLKEKKSSLVDLENCYKQKSAELEQEDRQNSNELY